MTRAPPSHNVDTSKGRRFSVAPAALAPLEIRNDTALAALTVELSADFALARAEAADGFGLGQDAVRGAPCNQVGDHGVGDMGRGAVAVANVAGNALDRVQLVPTPVRHHGEDVPGECRRDSVNHLAMADAPRLHLEDVVLKSAALSRSPTVSSIRGCTRRMIQGASLMA